MILRRIIAAAACALLLPQAAAGGEATADSAAARTLTIPAPGPGHFTPHSFSLRDPLDPPATGYLSLSLSMSSMSWYTPPTRFDAMMQGAGTAATVGMFLGAIGNTFGWFDEETTWLITGSLATVGAVYSGTRYEPQTGLRLKWSPGDDQ